MGGVAPVVLPEAPVGHERLTVQKGGQGADPVLHPLGGEEPGVPVLQLAHEGPYLLLGPGLGHGPDHQIPGLELRPGLDHPCGEADALQPVDPGPARDGHVVGHVQLPAGQVVHAPHQRLAQPGHDAPAQHLLPHHGEGGLVLPAHLIGRQIQRQFLHVPLSFRLRIGGAKPGPGSVQPTFHRALGDAEEPGDLPLRQPVQVEQPQHPGVPVAEPTERLLHGGLLQLRGGRVGQLLHRRLRAAGLPPIPVPPLVPGDAEEPGPKGGLVLQPRERFIGCQIRFLQDVLGVRSGYVELHIAFHREPVRLQQRFKIVHAAPSFPCFHPIRRI